MTDAYPPRSNSPVASRNRRWKETSAPRSKAVQQGKRYTSRRRAPCRHQVQLMPCTKMALRSASERLLLRSPPSPHGEKPELCRDREGSVEPRLRWTVTGLHYE